MNEPTVISTFAGCGGSSLGYKWAGFKELLAIEWDSNAVETFKLNFPDVPVWQRDIKTVTADEILDFLKIKKGELDLLDGSPPCQGFSTAGKRQVNDARNDLFREFARLIDGLQPKVFVMENVSGMIKGKMKGMFIEIMNTLKSMNYNVKCKLMNAMYYKVPQSRQRLIFIGVRKDIDREISFPEPSKKVITVGEALKGIEPISKNKLSELYLRYWKKAKAGEKLGKSFADWKLDPNKPSYTIRKKLYCFVHWNQERWLSINEYALIASYPESFKWINESDGVVRIGNSVPPKFMQAIAGHIKKTILD